MYSYISSWKSKMLPNTLLAGFYKAANSGGPFIFMSQIGFTPKSRQKVDHGCWVIW